MVQQFRRELHWSGDGSKRSQVVFVEVVSDRSCSRRRCRDNVTRPMELVVGDLANRPVG